MKLNKHILPSETDHKFDTNSSIESKLPVMNSKIDKLLKLNGFSSRSSQVSSLKTSRRKIKGPSMKEFEKKLADRSINILELKKQKRDKIENSEYRKRENY